MPEIVQPEEDHLEEELAGFEMGRDHSAEQDQSVGQHHLGR